MEKRGSSENGKYGRKNAVERTESNISLISYSDRCDFTTGALPDSGGKDNLPKDSATKEGTDTMDKGWAWLVAFASAITIFIASTMNFCAGVYNVVFLEEFEETKTVTAWVCGIPASLAALGGNSTTTTTTIYSTCNCFYNYDQDVVK